MKTLYTVLLGLTVTLSATAASADPALVQQFPPCWYQGNTADRLLVCDTWTVDNSGGLHDSYVTTGNDVFLAFVSAAQDAASRWTVALSAGSAQMAPAELVSSAYDGNGARVLLWRWHVDQ